jgi:uncharacterized protein YdhG (YjbR/CyaY superfamily)
MEIHMTPSPEVDAYMAALPDAKRAVMEELRATIMAAAPEADEVITYKMPGFKTHGRFLVSYDAYKQHYSLFPASDAVVSALGDAITPYLAGRGTIRFPADQPLPLAMIATIITVRVAENDATAGS